MERAAQLVAIIVLAASSFLYIQRRMDVPPEVEQLRATGVTSQDAGVIAAYLRVYGDMVLEDGQREDPYIKSLSDLKLRLRDIGNLTVGTGWKIGDKYPNLPAVLAERIKIDNFDRQVFHTQADTLAGQLERV